MAAQGTIQEWLAETDKALEALLNFKAYLKAWSIHPDLGKINDDLFMSVIGDLSDAGLMEWFDECPAGIDELREKVSGTET